MHKNVDIIFGKIAKFDRFFFRTNFSFYLTGDEKLRHSILIPTIGDDIVFTGIGDLFAALFLAHSTTKSNLAEALEYTVATVQAVLKNTLKSISSSTGKYINLIQFKCHFLMCHLCFQIRFEVSKTKFTTT